METTYSLFSVFGIEAEYMIVDKTTLKVAPLAESVLSSLNHGVVQNEVDLGEASVSNELVSHVIEIKCSTPEPDLNEIDSKFHKTILKINSFLSSHNAILMPTAIHPWMNPDQETVLWPYGQKEIYNQYNKIFDCRGHGWSNLQSIHINLPYANEEEFLKLYSAIRAVLPLIPYLAASSPFYEGKLGELADNRLAFYEKNQIRVPSITGDVIPEPLTSLVDYHRLLEKIYRAISPYDPEKILQHPWLNSRGAIVKFDVQAIEIRVMDIQESPLMDSSLIFFITELIKKVATTEEFLDNAQSLDQKTLRGIYDQGKAFSEFKLPLDYSAAFRSLSKETEINLFISDLYQSVRSEIPKKYQVGIETIIQSGNLSKRMVRASLSPELYQSLIHTLEANTIYG